MGITNRILFAAMLGLITAGCGATGIAAHPTPSTIASALTFADLRNRPLNLPSLAAGATCPADQSHDVHAVVTVGKGGPSFGFGPGPAYLSGIVQLYPGAFDNEIWMVDASYRGAVLVRGHEVNGTQVISFDEPTNPSGGPLIGAVAPPDPALINLTIQGKQFPFYSELDLPAADASYPKGSWRLFFDSTHIALPGCYAFQVDGLTFSTVIVIRVPDAARPGG